MKLVKHLLDVKGREIWSIGPEDTVFDAIKKMSDKGVGALPVVYAGKLIGIISERDYTRKVILKGRSSKETPVKEIMSAPVIFTTPEQPIEKCMALMTAKRIRHLPVMEDDQMVGIISIGDLVRAIIEQQETWIRELQNHVLEQTSIV